MKKSVLLVLSLLFVSCVVGLAFAAKGPIGKFDAKAGDTIYVCGCGEGCDCGSLAKKEGKCGCGKDWGCIEAYTTLSGLPQLLAEMLKKYPAHPLATSTTPMRRYVWFRYLGSTRCDSPSHTPKTCAKRRGRRRFPGSAAAAEP